MRTTVSLDANVAATVELLRRDRGLGVSAAVNELARGGMVAPPHTSATTSQTWSAPLGVKVDVTSVAAVLDLLDED